MISSFFNKVLPVFLGMFSIVLWGQKTTLSFGSCHKMDKPNSDVILKTIAAEKPDGFIWLGDIVYGEDGNSKDLKTKFDLLSKKVAYQNLKQNTKVYGIWDDHDYGINDGGADYVNKSESRRELFSFLELPKDHRAYQREGAYQAYTIQTDKHHVKLILLDNRYFKTPYVKSKNNRQQYRKDRKGTLLGKSQWAWLEKQLKNSNAKVHVFGCGIQLLSNKHRFEKWSNYPKERKKMLRLLQKYKVKNPIFLTGDRHMSELSLANIGYTSLIDATSSGMTEALTYNLTEENPYRISPTIGQNSYGQLIIDWTQNRISILFKNSKGIPLYEYQQDLMKY